MAHTTKRRDFRGPFQPPDTYRPNLSCGICGGLFCWFLYSNLHGTMEEDRVFTQIINALREISTHESPPWDYRRKRHHVRQKAA